MTKRTGFTLLESLIVLGLVALMLSFGTIYGRHVEQANAERAFWQNLKQNWQASQARSREGMGATTIYYFNNQIRFQWIDYQTQQHHFVDVAIPTTLTVVYFKRIQMDKNGYVQACTQTFQSKMTHKTYQMKIQLGWGGYRLVAQK